ncbi:MAG: hypothetical protein K0Q79_1946 [Flavipsychrobacter sp.]|jgi:hypothetical protein|nr:hypothetical protein [Flavipsychrobacter sp.]
MDEGQKVKAIHKSHILVSVAPVDSVTTYYLYTLKISTLCPTSYSSYQTT